MDIQKEYSILPETRAEQLLLLEILKEVKAICIKHNIKYWLIAGTLLGCVRSGGFIPWDDDLDIAMLREDYDKFSKIAPKELPKEYFYQTKKTDKYFPHNFAKIRRNGTLLVETTEKYPEKYHQGIFVDVFPFDYYPSEKTGNLIAWGQNIRNTRKKYKRGSLKRLLCIIYTHIFLYPLIIYTKLVKKNLEKKDVNKLYKNTKIIGPALNTREIVICNLNDIFPLKTNLSFEGEFFPIPNNYKHYLSRIFGDNYLILPPLHQRKSHAKRIVLNAQENIII